jgi:hypothetical protein
MSIVATPFYFGALRCGRRRLGVDLHFLAIGQVDRRLQDDLVAILDAFADLNLGAEIGGDRNLAEMADPVVDYGDLHPVLIEDDRRGGHDQRGRFARDLPDRVRFWALTALTTCSGVSPFASSFVGSMSTMICRYFFAGRRRQ